MKIEGYQIKYTDETSLTSEEHRDFLFVSKNNLGQVVFTKASKINIGTTVSFTVTPDLFESGKKKTVFYTIFDEFIVADDEDMNKSRDFAAFLMYQKKVNPVVAEFNLVWADTFENSMVFTSKPTLTNLPENEWKSHDKGFWLHPYLATVYPENANYLLHNVTAKHNLLQKTNVVDSVTALEQQVDLLTEIVKSLIDKSNAPEWSAQFLSKALEKSSQTLRTPQEITNDLVKYKDDLRVKVATYFNERNKA
jgi:hypothetical protein